MVLLRVYLKGTDTEYLHINSPPIRRIQHSYNILYKAMLHDDDVKVQGSNKEKSLCNDKNKEESILTNEQIETYLRDGVLVVENVLSKDEIDTALFGIHCTLLHKYNINTNQLYDTGYNLIQLSSTNGSGGILDIYYESYQILLFAINIKLFHITNELWKYSFCHNNESLNDLTEEQKHMWHPYGSFDCNKGYMYLDRIGYRIPTQLAYDLAAKHTNDTITSNINQGSTSTTKMNSTKKVIPIQRSLTPHLDCCPSNMYNNTDHTIKWRPIQCFVALTDATLPNHGGFEAVKGFHHEFYNWSQNRIPTTYTSKHSNGTTTIPAPCVGEYTHIRPKEDSDVFQRIEHIPVRAGSAVFWDNRIPHANSYRHDGTIPRVVVYCSFLPDVPINRIYVKNQLEHWKRGHYPSGNQWINNKNHRHPNNVVSTTTKSTKQDEINLPNKNKHSSDDDETSDSIQHGNQYRLLSNSCSETVSSKKTTIGLTDDEIYYRNCQVISDLLSTPLARKLAGWDDW